MGGGCEGGCEGGGGEGAVKTTSLISALTTPVQVMPKAVVGPVLEFCMRGMRVARTIA